MPEYSDQVQYIKRYWRDYGVSKGLYDANYLIIMMGIFEQLELQNGLLERLVDINKRGA